MLIKNTSLALAAFLPTPTPALEAGTLTTAALALVTGANSVGASLSAPATGEGWGGRKTIRPPASVPGVKEADLGVLKTEQRRVVECPTECDDGFVGYCAGTPIDANNACRNGVTGDQECCIGDRACYHFTGCVKKDGSCAGLFACGALACGVSSMIHVEGSCKGDTSCYCTHLGGKMENSCNAYYSCNNMGRDGKVETVISSCNAANACSSAGKMGPGVGMFIDSCNSDRACYGLGSYGGEVGAVTKSCNREKACYRLADGGFASGDGGLIKSITKTCNNDAHKPCQVLSPSGTVGHLIKFTHTDVGEKFKRDSIGSIEECNAQCLSDSECKGIKWKEHSSMPCRFFGGELSENKCNGRNVCITV